jgi:hypothetical protein
LKGRLGLVLLRTRTLEAAGGYRIHIKIGAWQKNPHVIRTFGGGVMGLQRYQPWEGFERGTG